MPGLRRWSFTWKRKPDEIVEKYWINDAGTVIYKPWYKVKKVKITLTWYCNTSWRPSVALWLSWWTSTWWSTVWINFRLQSQRWYNWYAFKYWGIGWFNPETATFEFTSSSTSRTGGSAITEFDIDGWTVKCWQTRWTWVQDTTFTTDSTYKERIKWIFESPDLYVWRTFYSDSWTTVSNDLLEVTFERAL